MPSRSQEPDTLGEKLRKKREALGFSIEDVAHTTQISSKYVRALEENDLEVFSAKVYALGSLKKILNAVTYEDKERAILEFASEWNVRMFRKSREITPLPENRGKNIYLTPLRLTLGFGAIFFIAFLAWGGFRFTNFVGSPKLNIHEPARDSMISVPIIRISGEVEKESSLTVNGRDITIDKNGNFNQLLELAAGLNALEFTAQDRFGKIAKEVRYILVK